MIEIIEECCQAYDTIINHMRTIVTHRSSDLDAIMSVWLLKRYIPSWLDARVSFVPAGGKLEGEYTEQGGAIEKMGENEIIHVDTGMGALDHHQEDNDSVCAAKLTYDYVIQNPENTLTLNATRQKAVERMVEIAIDVDHFQEVYYQDPTSYIYDFSVIETINGFRMMFPKDDQALVEFIMKVLDAQVHAFENRIWAEEEIAQKGVEFDTKWGKGLGIETLNDETLKLAQKMGYVLTVRKDPHLASVRIKVRPKKRQKIQENAKTEFESVDIDLTPVYEKLKEMDPEATWFLHAGKRMLLNGSSKNPEMRGTKISLDEAIEVLKNI